MDAADTPPVICDVCLGESEHLRLTKNTRGALCKICTLPFTVYHFKANKKDANLTKTVVCTKCSKQRNICQCCMLDMTWHIPMQLRDRMLSLINKDSSMITEEAKNDMMRKFLAFKNTELGGARITSDHEQVGLVMKELQHILTSKALPGEAVSTSQSESTPGNKLEKYKSVDISHLLRKIPFKSSFEADDAGKSFFLYNVNPSIPEWRISQSISQLVGSKNWQDNGGNSLIIVHKAKCGGIRLRDNELGLKLVQNLIQSNSILKTSKGLLRGILKIDQFQVFIIPWKSGFSTSSFGKNAGENIKLSLSLDRFMKIESSHSLEDKIQPATAKTATTINNNLAERHVKGKVTKKKNKTRRVKSLEL